MCPAAVELLSSVEFKPRNGTGVVCISPTRELALQVDCACLLVVALLTACVYRSMEY